MSRVKVLLFFSVYTLTPLSNYVIGQKLKVRRRVIGGGFAILLSYRHVGGSKVF